MGDRCHLIYYGEGNTLKELKLTYGKEDDSGYKYLFCREGSHQDLLGIRFQRITILENLKDFEAIKWLFTRYREPTTRETYTKQTFTVKQETNND